jgi:hypothetical protein
VQTPDKFLGFAVGNIFASTMSRQGRSTPIVCTQHPVAAIVTTMMMKMVDVARRFKSGEEATRKRPAKHTQLSVPAALDL